MIKMVPGNLYGIRDNREASFGYRRRRRGISGGSRMVIDSRITTKRGYLFRKSYSGYRRRMCST